jgi:hypothetical protein
MFTLRRAGAAWSQEEDLHRCNTGSLKVVQATHFRG